jgi:hypothetical protein
MLGEAMVTTTSREELEDALVEAYREFRRAKVCGIGALFTMPTLLKRVTALMGRISITARLLSRR